MNVNTVVIGGRLTRDPRVRSTGDGATVTEASIAVNRRYKRGDDWVKEPVFVDIVLFGRIGEAFVRHHSKGDPVLVTGRLRLDRWEDVATGEIRTKLYVVAEEWQFVGSRHREAQPEGSDDAAL